MKRSLIIILSLLVMAALVACAPEAPTELETSIEDTTIDTTAEETIEESVSETEAEVSDETVSETEAETTAVTEAETLLVTEAPTEAPTEAVTEPPVIAEPIVTNPYVGYWQLDSGLTFVFTKSNKWQLYGLANELFSSGIMQINADSAQLLADDGSDLYGSISYNESGELTNNGEPLWKLDSFNGISLD